MIKTPPTLPLTLATCLLCSVAIWGQDRIIINDAFEVIESRTIRFEPLRSTELLRSFEETGSSGHARASFRGTEVTANASGLNLTQLPAYVDREVSVRWRTSFDEEERRLPDRLRAEWVCMRGERSAAVVDGERVSSGIETFMGVPRLVAQDASSKTWEVQVRVRFPLKAMCRAGTLEGRLLIQNLSQ